MTESLKRLKRRCRLVAPQKCFCVWLFHGNVNELPVDDIKPAVRGLKLRHVAVSIVRHHASIGGTVFLYDPGWLQPRQSCHSIAGYNFSSFAVVKHAQN